MGGGILPITNRAFFSTLAVVMVVVVAEVASSCSGSSGSFLLIILNYNQSKLKFSNDT